MTSKGDSLKTNEFLRLRKLRLQQVREQSKDIAKKIRQRAKVEQLRHVTNVDPNKEKEYLQQQEKLVHRLEQLYTKSLQNVGASHKEACEVKEKEKKDLSKFRGREAAAALKRKKQEKLDEQKKLLERKLQAREVANELSREKIAVVANALLKSSSGKSLNNQEHGKVDNVYENVIGDNVEADKEKSEPETVTKNDMGTQWEFEELPNEWEPNIPTLTIPHDDSVKNSADDIEKFDQNRKNRRLNLFALSDEMPSSLRGGVTSIPDERLPVKPSLTLVSEYLQNRGLRLRESDMARVQKKKSDDLQSIKQTLLKTRASRTDGSVFPNICHVLDEQVIPVPCWRAERNCEYCSHVNTHISEHNKNRDINKSSILKPCFHPPSNYEKAKSHSKCYECHRGLKIPVSGRTNIERFTNSDDTNRLLSKKSSVTMYDHNTRDTRELPQNFDKLVVRDQMVDDDAYSQAVKEATLKDIDKSHHTLQQEARNRLAITRQNVDKEYRDTLAFLNSLPKEKSAKCMRTAYMDGDREQELKDKRQHKLQQEYKNIEKQNSKRPCKHTRNKQLAQERSRSKSKSPVTIDLDSNIINKDFQYSWLPVPEGDENMAIHNIPSNTKDTKTGNTVKFGSVDTYHEYRSRHKHTPPTKDINNVTNKRVVEAVIIHGNSNDSEDSSIETDTSSVENLQLRKENISRNKVSKDNEMDDAERIIVYKVIESKKTKNKKHKIKKKSQSVNNNGKDYGVSNNGETCRNDNITTNTVSFTHLQEGIYRKVSASGDNITSLYFSDDQHDGGDKHNAKNILLGKEDNSNADKGAKTKNGDNILKRNPKDLTDKCAYAATSTSSFKSAVNDKAIPQDDGYIKLVDEGRNDARIYVGTSGFLKDDAYEVIIQLRKKEAEKISNSASHAENNKDMKTSENSIKENNIKQNSIEFPSINEQINTIKVQNETGKQIISPNGNPDMTTTQSNEKVTQQSKESDISAAASGEMIVNGSKEDEPLVKAPEVSDKGISTTFRESFTFPDHMPKLDPISRPVNSIFTQTTPNSSFHRPVFMHLSSSTSTTYMSPPELILPRYLRKGKSESCDDTYEPVSRNFNSQNVKNKDCKRCGKFKSQKKESNADIPPNSTRSTDQSTDIHLHEPFQKFTSAQHKNRGHKCKKSSDSKMYSKQKFKRSSSEHRRLNHGNNVSHQPIKKRSTKNNLDKVNLNPVVEKYVKKLLALNKEGLKAIEVVNQECSVVNTPGSSVIDLPSNFIKNNTVSNKISLEQIKSSLEEQILRNIVYRKNKTTTTGIQTEKHINILYKSNKKRPVHKVKSFNVSRQLLKANKDYRRQSTQSTLMSTSPSSFITKKGKLACLRKRNAEIIDSSNSRQIVINQQISNNTSNSEISRLSKKSHNNGEKFTCSKIVHKTNKRHQSNAEKCPNSEPYQFPCHKSNIRTQSSESEASHDIRARRNLSTPPISISTQTNQIDSEIEFMKLAEDKLQNMEKIADLTEKCTRRLSNLAKVLEEVRRNKSLAYSQVSTSDCTTDSDQKSDKNVQTNNRAKTFNSTVQIETLSHVSMPEEKKNHDTQTYIPILKDLPKPDTFKSSFPQEFSTETNNGDADIFVGQQFNKSRGKPPPALNRINFKHVPEGFAIPHELSTVVEVDSPMSIKVKSHTTQSDNKHEGSNTENIEDTNLNKIESPGVIIPSTYKKSIEPIDLIDKFNASKRRHETLTDTSDDSKKDPKVKMMDLKYFNDIMLKPFISLKDYAKQYNLDEPDGQTSLNAVSKEENIEELSSLHSETSIPDVVAELLKRNLISEPFKFETTSNVNSTTVSSESTLSLLALSRARKDKKKSAMIVKNKENMTETSVSLSISSNPDLENAFRRLGMGWASSTLKKTKERLALSSSSNTSSSSIPQFKTKSFNFQDIPELSSLLNTSNRDDEMIKPQVDNLFEIPKNALQQTSLTNSMTVKEFLTNELANKITFSNKTNRNSTDQEFISLYETKIPDEIRNESPKSVINEKSVDSIPSGANNRARTSTPVQIFKSMAYHSSSSSNTSNGLFSNADDLSSVKGTSNSNKYHSTSDKDDLTIPNYSLKVRKEINECSKSD